MLSFSTERVMISYPSPWDLGEFDIQLRFSYIQVIPDVTFVQEIRPEVWFPDSRGGNAREEFINGQLSYESYRSGISAKAPGCRDAGSIQSAGGADGASFV
jgi:hypothetical protein